MQCLWNSIDRFFFLSISLFSFLIVKTKRRTLSHRYDLEYNSFLLVEHFLRGTCDQISIYDEYVIKSNILFKFFSKWKILSFTQTTSIDLFYFKWGGATKIFFICFELCMLSLKWIHFSRLIYYIKFLFALR